MLDDLEPGSAEHRQAKIIAALHDWHEVWNQIYSTDNMLLEQRKYKEQDYAMKVLEVRLSIIEKRIQILSKGIWDGHTYRLPPPILPDYNLITSRAI